METYFLFGGLFYYPGGGLSDLQATVQANSLTEARNKFEYNGHFAHCEWWQIGGIRDGRLRLYSAGNVDNELDYA